MNNSHATTTRGPQVSAECRARLLQRFREIYVAVEADFSEFEREAVRCFSSIGDEDKLAFVIRRLWRDWCGQPPGHWREIIVSRYSEFVASFQWRDETAPAWIPERLLVKTLRIFQPCYAENLKVKHAVEMLVNVGRFADIAEKCE